MSLTGVWLIVLAFLAVAAVAALTVRGWSRFGSGRYAVRAGGVLLVQGLLVASIGLVANRSEGFYPSWAALAGNPGTTAAQQSRAVGQLDGELADGAVTWHPAAAPAWHLAGAATLSVPSGYEASAALSYPVVVELRPSGRIAAPGAITVTLPVTAKTTVKALASLPAELSRDVRAEAGGWALVAPVSLAALAEGLARTAPQRYVAVALVGAAPASIGGSAPAGSRPSTGGSRPSTGGSRPPTAGSRPPTAGGGGSAPAGARPPGAAGGGLATAGTHPPRAAGGGFVVRTVPDWTAAVRWAAGQTAAPLAAPVVLPRAPRS